MFPRPLVLALSLVLFPLLGSCYSTTQADLEKYFEGDALFLTEGKAPEGAEPIKILSVYKSGFYLLGVAPIVKVDLEESIKLLCDGAKKLGADGIAHISFDYRPASLFKFTLFPIPDWSASIHVQGMAWRRAEGGQIQPKKASSSTKAVDFQGKPGS
jgi:hypothetical protein